MDYRLRQKVWEHYDGRCQICGENLYDLRHFIQLEDFRELGDIPIYKWSKPCWKCGKVTPRVSYSFVLGYNWSIGDIDKLDTLLRERYVFVREVYSNTQGKIVTANICIHCGALQGNFFITQELLHLGYREDFKEIVDSTLSCDLEFSDLDLDEDALAPVLTRSSQGHVHHVDENRENNELSNLVLLCASCHRKVHSGKASL